MRSGRAFIRTRLVWVAWYPLRGRKCMWHFERATRPQQPHLNGWHLAIAVGPAYLGLGPGVPTP
ncbi:hypothetical protein [Microcystis phage MinS1]|nr:hypothetical protein [Microcystis phage MinS1]